MVPRAQPLFALDDCYNVVANFAIGLYGGEDGVGNREAPPIGVDYCSVIVWNQVVFLAKGAIMLNDQGASIVLDADEVVVPLSAAPACPDH